MTSSLHPQWDFAREIRSILLRFVAFAILLANLLLGGNEGAERMHSIVVVSYLVISVASVAMARYLSGRAWLKTAFVVFDALLVALLLYAHILAGPVNESHNLTTTSLVVAFILLVHVGLKLERRLVLIFSGIVLTSWVTMLAITAARHPTAGVLSLLGSFFNQDLGLTVSFGFTAFAIYLLARDHDRTRKEALKADQRRLNLSRFSHRWWSRNCKSVEGLLVWIAGMRQSCSLICAISLVSPRPHLLRNSPSCWLSIASSSRRRFSNVAAPSTNSLVTA